MLGERAHWHIRIPGEVIDSHVAILMAPDYSYESGLRYDAWLPELLRSSSRPQHLELLQAKGMRAFSSGFPQLLD